MHVRHAMIDTSFQHLVHKVKFGKRERKLHILAKDLETERYKVNEYALNNYDYRVKALEARLCWCETNNSQWQCTSQWEQLRYAQRAERKKQADDFERRVILEEEIRARVKEELNKRQN